MDKIGQKVVRKNGKPFMSGQLTNTVKGIERDGSLDLSYLFFEEDNSIVKERDCMFLEETE